MRTIARLALVVCAVAVAIWLVPASVQIVSWPSSGPVRVALMPPLERLRLALVGTGIVTAVLVNIWRRRGGSVDTLARALDPLVILLTWIVPFLPWLPDRAPLLLVLAGPLRWAVAAVAAAAVLVRSIAPLAARVGRPWVASRRMVFVVSFAIYVALGVRSATQIGFGGDEPHYLIITHSLLADRDLDIANNHAQRDYRSFFAGNLRPDFLRRGLHEEIYSIHAPGLPALLLPAYAIAGALGATIVMALLGALTALAIFDAALAVAGASAATVAWLATAFTVPFIPHAWLIYPEIAGALVVAWAVRRWWTPPTGLAWTALYGLALGALPWLHTKFVIFLGLFALAEVVRLWPRMRHIAVFLAPIAVSGVAWLYSFYVMYGVVDPEAPYGSYTQTFVLARNIPRGTLGLLIDQKFGLLVYAPVYALALVGLWQMLRDAKLRAFAIATLTIALAYFVSSTRLYMWWGGASAPARFLVPLVPLLAPAVAVVMARWRGDVGRAAVVAIVALSLTIAAIAVGSPRGTFLYSDPHGVAALARAVQGSAPLDASWPTFTEEDWRTPLALLAVWLIALVVAFAATFGARRFGVLRRPFWIAATATTTFVLIGSLATRPRPAEIRTAVAQRGQLALLEDFDPSQLHAVNATRVSRMDQNDVLQAAKIVLRASRDESASDARPIAPPIPLPEGRYEMRAWFDGAAAPDAEASVRLSNDVILGRTGRSRHTPVTVPFELPIGAPVFLDTRGGAATLEIAPLSVVPRSTRASPRARIVEPAGGSVEGFIAYLDEATFPESGVFWTRGTEKGTIAVVTSGASTLRLILHVGPNGGPVVVEANGRRVDVDLARDETREIDLPIAPGMTRMIVSIQAARSFRPAAIDAASDDRRPLGCQVRPQLY